MTNYERLIVDKSELAYSLMCPYDGQHDCGEHNTCIDCCMEWLDKEIEDAE